MCLGHKPNRLATKAVSSYAKVHPSECLRGRHVPADPPPLQAPHPQVKHSSNTNNPIGSVAVRTSINVSNKFQVGRSDFVSRTSRFHIQNNPWTIHDRGAIGAIFHSQGQFRHFTDHQIFRQSHFSQEPTQRFSASTACMQQRLRSYKPGTGGTGGRGGLATSPPKELYLTNLPWKEQTQGVFELTPFFSNALKLRQTNSESLQTLCGLQE